MKKSILFTLLALLPVSSVWADVEIDETNFPDESFRNWILAQDYGSDGILTKEEISSVKEIYVRFQGKGIKNLQGIEFFTALTELDCSYNQLTSLDVSKNTALKELTCKNNQLTSLDVSKNTTLTKLDCGVNQLSSLDVSKNTALTELYCYENQFSSLDVSGCTALTKLSCGENQLTTLDVSGCTALKSLSCSYNQLTSLDVSKNTALTWLWCHRNRLTTLDVSKNTVLTELDCYYNKIKGAGMDAFVASLPTISNGWMKVIYYENEQNVMTTTQVATAKAKGWVPYYHDGSSWQEYAGGEPVVSKDIAINATNFPDENFRNWILSRDRDSDGVLSEEEIAGMIDIHIGGAGIKSLQGIEFFTALTGLHCNSNKLTSLDVSKNTKLMTLECGYNQLTSLNVSGCTALTKLHCYNNQLTALDVSQNTEMNWLDCASNHLISLDVSKNTKLEELRCYSNNLTMLDLSKNTMLTRLFCHDNKLISINLSGCSALNQMTLYCNNLKGNMGDVIENIPTISNGMMRVIYSENEGNVMTTIQVAAAKAKGWTPYYYDGSSWQEYAGSESNLRGDVNGDGKVSMADAMFIVNYLLNGKYPDEE